MGFFDDFKKNAGGLFNQGSAGNAGNMVNGAGGIVNGIKNNGNGVCKNADKCLKSC